MLSKHCQKVIIVGFVKPIREFRSPFTVNVERSYDQKIYVNVHRKKVVVKVVSDQRTCTMLSLKPLALNC